jgi:hypothetical protein
VIFLRCSLSFSLTPSLPLSRSSNRCTLLYVVRPSGPRTLAPSLNLSLHPNPTHSHDLSLLARPPTVPPLSLLRKSSRPLPLPSPVLSFPARSLARSPDVTVPGGRLLRSHAALSLSPPPHLVWLLSRMTVLAKRGRHLVGSRVAREALPVPSDRLTVVPYVDRRDYDMPTASTECARMGVFCSRL